MGSPTKPCASSPMSGRANLSLLLAVFLFLLQAGHSFGQMSGQLVVTVVDEFGDPVAGATIKAKSNVGGVSSPHATTNDPGRALLSGLPLGKHLRGARTPVVHGR